MQWDQFFISIAQFSGVVFAVVLATKQLAGKAERHETKEERHTRWRDSVATTYELAAVSLLSILYFLHGSWLAFVAASVIVGIGLYDYGRFLAAYRTQARTTPAATTSRASRDPVSARLVVVPALAMVAAAVSFTPGALAGDTARTMLASAVLWLVLSGMVQALLWYRDSWGLAED